MVSEVMIYTLKQHRQLPDFPTVFFCTSLASSSPEFISLDDTIEIFKSFHIYFMYFRVLTQGVTLLPVVCKIKLNINMSNCKEQNLIV